MTAVAVAPLGRTEVVQWLSPAPLWDVAVPGSADPSRPWISELRSDDFLDEFAGMLAGTNGTPNKLAELEPEFPVDKSGGAPYRLFQPLSQRYYLVSATLACRRPGIPDHSLRRERNENAYFVMRRLGPNGEQAFVPGLGGDGAWTDVAGDSIVDGEREYPMSQARVEPYSAPGCATAALGLQAGTGTGRTVWYGYVPVGVERELVRPMADPAQRLRDMMSTASSSLEYPAYPALEWLYQRVILPWRSLVKNQATTDDRYRRYASLMILVDFADWLSTHLSEVWSILKSGGTTGTAAYDDLKGKIAGRKVKQNGADVSLSTALVQASAYIALLTGGACKGADDVIVDDADLRGALHPASSSAFPEFFAFDLWTDVAVNGLPNVAKWVGDIADGGAQIESLARYASAALKQADRVPALPPELEGMIQEAPPAPAIGAPKAAGGGAVYVIRMVLRFDPCGCVISAPSHPFELAKALDADAPARKVLLQMPDITQMRKFNRGVAIEMPPSLIRVLNRITPDFLKETKLGADLGVQLGMICSFSLQIIFLVAFIVMFIFLILLNIVFWWLPFLKICFPIPKMPSGGP